MEFVDDGGYEKIEFWDDEGKEFLKISKAKYPPFWYLQTQSVQVPVENRIHIRVQ